MGKFSRSKGKRFERKIAKRMREAVPHLSDVIRRSIQSRQAEESDVTGIPGLWIECQDAVDPTPAVKLNQAIRDVEANYLSDTIPIAITHKTGARSTEVTMRLEDLMWMYKKASRLQPGSGETQIQMDLDSFIDLMTLSCPWNIPHE